MSCFCSRDDSIRRKIQITVALKLTNGYIITLQILIQLSLTAVPRIWKQDRENTENNLIDLRMNSKTPASVKSIMTLYSSLSFRLLYVSYNADFHKQQVACFRFDVFLGELISNPALIRVTFLSLVSVSFCILEWRRRSCFRGNQPNPHTVQHFSHLSLIFRLQLTTEKNLYSQGNF